MLCSTSPVSQPSLDEHAKTNIRQHPQPHHHNKQKAQKYLKSIEFLCKLSKLNLPSAIFMFFSLATRPPEFWAGDVVGC